MKDTVYIYAGEQKRSSVLAMMLRNFGQSFARNGLKVAPVFGCDLLEERWRQDAFALIIGGMESTIMRNALSPGGVFQKHLIQDARADGVHIAGFCGGAIMGYDQIEFKGANGYARAGAGFGLYPRKSFGAASGFTPKDFTGLSDSAAIISLKHAPSNKFFHSLYCCGPDFPAHDMPEETRILATARNPQTGENHIMAVQIPSRDGCGSVSLYGHHPEYLSDFIDFRTREVPSIPLEDDRLRAEAARNAYGILLGFNLMLSDLKTAMGLRYEPHHLIVPEMAPPL